MGRMGKCHLHLAPAIALSYKARSSSRRSRAAKIGEAGAIVYVSREEVCRLTGHRKNAMKMPVQRRLGNVISEIA